MNMVLASQRLAGPLFLAASTLALAFGSEVRADETSYGQSYTEPAQGDRLPVQTAQAASDQTTSDQNAAESPQTWWDAVKFYGHLEAGFTANPDGPASHRNLGRLFDDHSNIPVLNQLSFTAERPLDPKATGYDFGFKFQPMFGSDSRFTHVYNLFDHAIDDTHQLSIVEAYGSAHVTGIGEGGTDAKLGIFASPMSAEYIDASQNLLYSHSYIFNFGVPFQHTGFLTVTHLTSVFDLYAGLDTGVNAWLGRSGGGLNNSTWPHGQAGLGLNLLGGNLTIVGLSHIGPENPKRVFGSAADSDLRYLNDAVVTWKANDSLTLTTYLNYIHDDGLRASGYGGAQYVAYAINEHLTLIGRGEIWRDNNGAFVASFKQPFDFINAERGLATSPGGVVGGGRTTYGELTAGVNIKPEVPKLIEGFVIRPELRWDQSLNGTRPFNDRKTSHQVTIAADFILPFSF